MLADIEHALVCGTEIGWLNRSHKYAVTGVCSDGGPFLYIISIVVKSWLQASSNGRSMPHRRPTQKSQVHTFSFPSHAISLLLLLSFFLLLYVQKSRGQRAVSSGGRGRAISTPHHCPKRPTRLRESLVAQRMARGIRSRRIIRITSLYKSRISFDGAEAAEMGRWKGSSLLCHKHLYIMPVCFAFFADHSYTSLHTYTYTPRNKLQAAIASR